MQLIKSQNSFEKESSIEKERERRSASRSKEEEKSVKIKEERSSAKDDVNFLIQVIIFVLQNHNIKITSFCPLHNPSYYHIVFVTG